MPQDRPPPAVVRGLGMPTCSRLPVNPQRNKWAREASRKYLADIESEPLPMNRLIVFALLLGTSGCADIQAQGFVPWRQAAARFQQAYNACHEDKSCSDKAWANYRAELAAISAQDGLKGAILSPRMGF